MTTQHMEQESILSRRNTQWVQGVSALLIMVMHFALATHSLPRLFNVLGSLGVAVFLFVSGFGLNESWKVHGLGGYWRKRILRVVLPCWIVMLFKLPFEEYFNLEQLIKNLSFCGSELWFVDYILKWYLAYWLCRRFFSHHTTQLLAVCSLMSVFCQQLESEQSLSFFMGYIASVHYERIKRWSRRRVLKITIIATVFGLFFYIIKALPPMRPYIGTLFFNILLLNIKLPMATAVITLPYLVNGVKRLTPINWCGRACYELYIVHFNFMSYITGAVSIVAFSSLSLAISAIFKRFNDRMKERGHLMETFALLLFVGINYMLLTKYSIRLTPHFGYLTIPYAMLLVVVGLWIVGKRDGLRHPKVLFFLSLALLTVGLIVVQYHFDPQQNRVDRWSAIANPISALFQGEFPYLAKTHLGGSASPFPMWMIFHIPFWALGNVGLSSIVATVLFLLSVKYLCGYETALKATVLLALSVCLWYEVSVRSDMITNFLLLAAFINVLQRKQLYFEQHPYILSVMAGLWLSTRISVAFPLFALFFGSWLALPVKEKALSILFALLSFCLTFLPLAVWDVHTLFFFDYSPFILQTRQGSLSDAFILLLLAFIMALKSQHSFQRQQFSSACLLIFAPVVAFIHSMIIRNNWTELFNSTYDITYFDTSIPFLVMVVAMSTMESTSRQKCM